MKLIMKKRASLKKQHNLINPWVFATNRYLQTNSLKNDLVVLGRMFRVVWRTVQQCVPQRDGFKNQESCFCLSLIS